VTTLNVQNTGSSAPHNGAVVSVSEVCFDGNVDVSFDLFQTYDNNFVSINEQLGEKLTGAPGASVIDESNMVGMVVLDKNHYSSHDSFGFSSIDVSQIVQTNVQALDGAANGF
jgi:hypothetical protein